MTARLFILLFFPLVLFGQTEKPKSEFAPCGTRSGLSSWLVEYAQNREQMQERSQDTLLVGLQIHLLANDFGVGRFSTDRLLNAFCRLNSDFAASGIRFYFKNPWNLINKTAWHKHDDIPAGIDMMLTNNVPGTLNIYFVQDPAGNCGYNLPYGGVAVNHSCANADDHTWAHEVGHALSLPHPFIGWEGKDYSFNTPTPQRLTYDYTYFHDTLDTTVPAPLDTAWVEYVDGFNCDIAADLFCDTKPDYLSYRWPCDAQNNSTKKQKDPAGAEFYSDGTLFMSYSSDECQNRFSPQQIAAMRANLNTEHSAWLGSGPAEGDITDKPVLAEPVQNAPAPDSAVVLRWSAVPNATMYYVWGSRISTFPNRDFEMITSDTFAVTGKLLTNKKYYWKVRPFNNYYACTTYSTAESFTSSLPVAVTEPLTGHFRCYPGVITPGGNITLELNDLSNDQADVEILIFDALGRIYLNQTTSWSGGKIRLNLPAEMRQSGLYQVVARKGNHTETARIMLVGK